MSPPAGSINHDAKPHRAIVSLCPRVADETSNIATMLMPQC